MNLQLSDIGVTSNGGVALPPIAAPEVVKAVLKELMQHPCVCFVTELFDGRHRQRAVGFGPRTYVGCTEAFPAGVCPCRKTSL